MSQRPVIRLQAIVEPGGRITIQDDRLLAGTAVELMVLLPSAAAGRADADAAPVFHCATEEEAYHAAQEADADA